MRFVFDVAGETLVERRLLRVSGYAGDARPAFESIADLLMTETQAQFETEGRHASGGWKPLKKATLEAKRRKGLDPRILHAAGALERSLTRRGDENQLLNVGRDELQFGSRLPYALAHQRPRATSRLPQRRPIDLTEQAKREILKRLQRYVMTGSVA